MVTFRSTKWEQYIRLRISAENQETSPSGTGVDAGPTRFGVSCRESFAVRENFTTLKVEV